MNGELPIFLRDATDRAHVKSYVDQFIRECERDPNRVSFLSDADDNFNLLIDNANWNLAKNAVPLPINRIRPAINALVAAQANDPYAIKFNARELGEPATYFIDPGALGPKSGALLESIGVELGMPIGQEYYTGDDPKPLPRFVGKALASRPEAQDILISVTGKTVADTVKVLYKMIAKRGHDEAIVVENVFNKETFGLGWTLTEWDNTDPKNPRPVYTNCHHKSVHIDSLCTEVDRANGLTYSTTITAAEALRRFPAFKDEVLMMAKPGAPRPDPLFSQAEILTTLYSERPLLNFRMAWFRDQRIPMSLKEAAEANYICPTPDSLLDTYVEEPDKPKYMMKNGTPIEDQDPNWPFRLGIREIIIIEDAVVGYTECKWPTIPMCKNKCGPIPYSPYAEGTPKRLKYLQEGINAIMSDIRTHCDFFGSPAIGIMKSLADSMEAQFGKGFSCIGAKFKIPDDVFLQLKGQVMSVTEPPAAPQHLFDFVKMLLDLIDKEAGNPEVMQGDAKAKWSGSLVKTLQSAAMTVLQFDSIFTEHYIEELAFLTQWAIVKFMTIDDWTAIIKKYPPHVVRYIFARAGGGLNNPNHGLDWDIEAEVASGSASVKAQAKTDAVNLFLAQRPDGAAVVSQETTVESTSEQPQIELPRIQREKQETMQMQADQQQAQIAAQSQAGQQTGGAGGPQSSAAPPAQAA